MKTIFTSTSLLRGRRLTAVVFALLILAAVGLRLVSAAGQVSLTALNTAYTQDFNTLASNGTSGVVPAGWAFSESSTNANTLYTAGTGSSNTGDTYSFGLTGSTERAFGMLRSGNLVTIIGAGFTNNTGSTINELEISYTGEQWRLGTSGRGPDRIDFQISTNATSLTTGTYTDVNSLDFSSPVTVGTVGLLNGNLAANRAAISATISGLSIPNGASFFIRWTDFDVSGADDGLAVDDFSITPRTSGDPTGTGAASPASLEAGNPTLLTVTVTPGTSPVSTGLAVTADLTQIGGSATQQFYDDATHGDVTANDNIFSFQTIVGSLVPAGAKNLPATIRDAQARTGSATITLTVLPPLLAIHQIQGSASASPYAGTQVRTTGIVTGLKSNAFFIQTPDADADPNTSEGIQVFIGGALPAAAAVGNLVSVTGTVSEFIPSADPNSPPLTEISGSPQVTLISSGNPLPTPVTLAAADTSPTGGIEQLERYEGMRVHVDSLTAIAPTQGTISEANATSTSNGVFYGVITGVARPFREPGVEVPDPLPAGAPCCVPRFDANPERLRVDSNGLTGAPILNVTTGAVITNLTGPLDYSFRAYTILPDPAVPATVTGNISAIPVPVAGADEFTVASFNTERFFDTVNDPGISDVALTTTAFNNRLNKISLAIRNVMRTPDIIGVQEVENLAVLQAIADKVNDDAVAAGDPSPAYQAYLEEGNDVGGIDVGFLVKTAGSRVTVVDVTQEGKDTTYINPNNNQPELLNDRPSLVLRAIIQHPAGPTFPVTVINNHLRSLSGVDDAADGNRVRTKRRAQAEFLANLIQARQATDPNEHIISVGDYNAFQFNDGYVDTIGTIKGTPTPANQVTLASGDLVNPDLIDLVDYAPAGERYSFSFDGNAQELDHAIITGNLLARFVALRYARNDADFPESFRGDATRPERISDHDPTVTYFSFPRADLALTKSGSPGNVMADAQLTYTITVSNTLTDAAENVSVSDLLPANTVFQSISAPADWTCNTPNVGSTGTVSCGAPSLAGNSSATLTVVVKVNCDVPNGASIENTATVSATTLDPDTANNSQTASVTVSNPPPVISGVSATPSELWPPNHRMVDVTINYTATDTCGPVACSLGVSSSEPDNGTGDGDTAPDWEVIDAHHVRLRAERAGSGSGRIYTITIICTDSAGGTSNSTVAVTVPKSRGK
ncbi:MAG TPA: nuclease [Blastocatellia bacterium]|nr:nuclease [Blastocatellia bacterium]